MGYFNSDVNILFGPCSFIFQFYPFCSSKNLFYALRFDKEQFNNETLKQSTFNFTTLKHFYIFAQSFFNAKENTS
ncbi:hypothetical protein GCM10022289_12100 [Pedobacter jeongneungensis]|uniref:Uncharacterized protein n=1 Tax=Pedobacter jeongneungensis TaxID=947309 RepID=A0ABP8B7Y5_9SPHI